MSACTTGRTDNCRVSRSTRHRSRCCIRSVSYSLFCYQPLIRSRALRIALNSFIAYAMSTCPYVCQKTKVIDIFNLVAYVEKVKNL